MRRAPFVVALALLALGCPPRDPPEAQCLAAVGRGFARVRDAAQLSTELCLRRRAAGRSVAECADSDRLRLVEGARALALTEGARACRADALPPIGYAGVPAAAGAAEASVRALARGLFGAELDAARTPRRVHPRAARCRERVLAAAGRCAAAFGRSFEACAVDAVASGAEDPLALVECKGRDRGAAVARACDAGVRSALANGCRGLDVAALFPGCEGDVAACARGHARRSVSLALNEAHALCEDAELGTLDEETAFRCYEPPPPEPIEWSAVPTPPGVNPVTVEWSESGETLLIGFTGAPEGGTRLGALAPDGSGFRCLTCSSPMGVGQRPVQGFADRRRVLLAGPNAPAPAWSVLECAPSVLDCVTAETIPIELPANPDPATPILQYRVPWVTRDDGWLVWSEVRLRGPGGNVIAMGRLVRDAGRYVVVDARVIAPPPDSLAMGADPERWRLLAQAYEAKLGGLRGGRDQVVAGNPSAGQYDAMLLDLATGELRPLTRHPDHDEGIRFTRDERWAVVQSARTDERTEFLGRLPRPPYLDWAAFPIHFVGIAGAPGEGQGLAPGTDPDERDCFVDPWLVDRWFERGGYLGQRLLRPADGWVSIEGNAGGFGFSPDGTKLALIERRWRGAPAATRLRIASFPSRVPIEEADAVSSVPTPEPTWATRYEEWIVPDTSGVTVIPGRAAGTATVRNAATAIRGEVEVAYIGYSDDGARFLDGFERLRIPTLVAAGAVYEVDLALRGAQRGSMRGAIGYDFVADRNEGEVVTTLDGRTWKGPRTCYGAGLIPVP